MNNKILSIVYSKLTGEIYLCNVHSNPQSVSMFGDFKEEFAQAFNVINIAYNHTIYTNKDQFKINLDTNEIEAKPIVNTLGEIQYI